MRQPTDPAHPAPAAHRPSHACLAARFSPPRVRGRRRRGAAAQGLRPRTRRGSVHRLRAPASAPGGHHQRPFRGGSPDRGATHHHQRACRGSSPGCSAAHHQRACTGRGQKQGASLPSARLPSTSMTITHHQICPPVGCHPPWVVAASPPSPALHAWCMHGAYSTITCQPDDSRS